MQTRKAAGRLKLSRVTPTLGALLLGATLAAAGCSAQSTDDTGSTNTGGNKATGGNKGTGGSTGGSSGTGGSTGGSSGTGGSTGGSSGDAAAGGSSGSGGSGDASSETGGGAATFADVMTILKAHCNGCHGKPAAMAPAGFSIMGDDAAVLANLTADATGPMCTGKGKRVVAANSGMSILYSKISSATPTCGARMPRNMPALADKDIMTIKAWIDAGAKM
jgi:hypothetical protein